MKMTIIKKTGGQRAPCQIWIPRKKHECWKGMIGRSEDHQITTKCDGRTMKETSLIKLFGDKERRWGTLSLRRRGAGAHVID